MLHFLRRLFPLALSVFAAAALAAQDPGTTYHVAVDQQLTPQQHALLHTRYDPGCATPGARVELYLQPVEYAEVLRLGIRLRVLGRGRPFAVVAAENARTQLMPDTNYYTPAEIEQEIDRYVAAYPALARKVDITMLPGAAKTHENRSLFACKISDNVGVDEDEPAIVIASEHHARELNTPVVVFGAIDRILQGYATNPTLKALVDDHEIYCVPCVNPDGTNRVWTVDQWWRKNMRGGYGVDLNRNYPFLWGLCGASSNTGSDTYKGPTAGSEPETQTMMALQRWLRPEIYLDFHSSGREVLATYAPCATVNAQIRSMLQGYADDLRQPMNYATRNPSASGEAPEWHWSDGGTMSFLTEISTSFQPAYTSALAEAARVWPGIERALTTWDPSVRGHVRSIYKSEPVGVTITYAPNVFNLGERAASRTRDGRYALWLPIGTHQVTFAAPGFRSVTKSVQVASRNTAQTLDVMLVPVMAPASIGKQGSDRIGTTTTLTYTSPDDGGERYWILLSLGTTPGIPVGADRVVPLNFDIAFRASMPPSILLNSFGTLPGTGVVSAGFPIPAIQDFVGLTVHAAGVTENTDYQSFVKNFSPAIPITILR